jgi:hypothetical protein
MSRTVTPKPFEVFSFDELSEDAQETATEEVRASYEVDLDDIGQVIAWALAEALGSPGWDMYGPGDFLGIDGVKLVGWDVGRSWTIQVTGVLTRENAPKLPWVEGADAVHLATGYHGCTDVGVSTDDEGDVTPAWVDVMQEEVRDALDFALRAGRNELEYLTGDECARERVGEYEFLADGSLYRG